MTKSGDYSCSRIKPFVLFCILPTAGLSGVSLYTDGNCLFQ